MKVCVPTFNKFKSIYSAGWSKKLFKRDFTKVSNVWLNHAYLPYLCLIFHKNYCFIKNLLKPICNLGPTILITKLTFFYIYISRNNEQHHFFCSRKWPEPRTGQPRWSDAVRTQHARHHRTVVETLATVRWIYF